MCIKNVFLFIFLSFFVIGVQAQLGKPVRGIVKDRVTDEPLPFATIRVIGSAIGTTTDSSGIFCLSNVPIGRYDIQASFMGYDPMLIREVMISSGKENYLTISLQETLNQLQEVIVKPKVNKQEPLNNIASASARMLSVEEASRYAGGFDDPARLVTSFAGVGGSISSNGIAIRGNSPQFLQWRLEGVEIPNPTHFSDVTGVGGGILTALSSQVLGNSDFFTGAFPAEYSNALSGVFDMQLRNGNSFKREHTVQIGTLGIDVSSEGPFKKGGKASYLFNYRYATMSLADKLFPGLLGEAAGMGYQDLSFKMNFPTKRAGTFSIWGIGILDEYMENYNKDTTSWVSTLDGANSKFNQAMATGGIGHKIFLHNNAYIKTSLAATYNKNHILSDIMDMHINPTRVNDMQGTNWSVVLNSFINKKFSTFHTNRSGINVTGLLYNIDYNISPSFPNTDLPIANFARSDGSTLLLSAFSNSTIRLYENLTANVGLTGQYFLLNEHFSIEPRIGIRWQFQSQHALGLAYGKHSRHEKLDYYFVTTPETGNELVNKKLDFAKAHHIVFSYDWSISENLHVKFEPYFQYLYDVPVMEDGSFSIINHEDWYLTAPLVNKGKGRNYGLDITLERYLANGYYYMITGSVFNSRYTGGDGIWHDTWLNRNFLFNVLGGKEWVWGTHKQNIFNINLRFSYQGGDRYSPIDEVATLQKQDVVYDTSRAYEVQLDPAFISNATVSYKLNKKKLAHEFAIKVINATGYQELSRHFSTYNLQKAEMYLSSIVIPNISYKLEF